MTVPQETEVNIVRLHYGEHWPIGTIAAQLGIHPDVVKRVLSLKRAKEPTAPRVSARTAGRSRVLTGASGQERGATPGANPPYQRAAPSCSSARCPSAAAPASGLSGIL